MDTLLALAQSLIETFAWSDLMLIVALVFLEAALSADNAVALAALVRHLPTVEQRNRALRLGILGAYGFRILIILAATWIVEYRPAQILGAAYLLWLALQHFREEEGHESEHIPGSANFWQTILLVELTDLAFSFDSIAASIAVSRKTWVVILGGILGITLMRYMAMFFLRWLDEYSRLEDAAYFMISLMGTRMLLDAFVPGWEMPEWPLMCVVLAIFVWGFSKRTLSPSSDPPDPSLEFDGGERQGSEALGYLQHQPGTGEH